MIVPTLVKFMDKHEDVYLKIVGEFSIPEELNKYKKQGRLIIKKRVSLEELQSEIASVDLNIVPLANTPFNSSRSEHKFFEAAVVETPTLASSTHTYQNAIEDRVNGYLASSNDEWYNKLDEIYNKRNLKDIAHNAEIYSKYNFYNINMLNALENIFDSLLSATYENSITDYQFKKTKDITETKQKESDFPIKAELHY